MNKFGSLKVKILHNLTESYIAGDMKKVSNIIKLIRENMDFKELYLFYEEIENMYLDDKDVAEIFVENVEKLLKTKIKKVSKYCKQINKGLMGENLGEVELYKYLDLLIEDDNLKNIDKKIIGKKKLIEFITTKKELKESINQHTNNERLLHFVLTEKFNNDFEKMLNEEDKNKMVELLSMSDDDLSNEFNSLKEEITEKINTMMLTENDETLKNKMDEVMSETNKMSTTKYNYYKLQQLRDGL